MNHEDFFLYGKNIWLVNPERKGSKNEFGKVIEARRTNSVLDIYGLQVDKSSSLIEISSSREESSKNLPGEFSGAATSSPW